MSVSLLFYILNNLQTFLQKIYCADFSKFWNSYSVGGERGRRSSRGGVGTRSASDRLNV